MGTRADIDRESDTFRAFEQWLRENGAKFPKVGLTSHGGEMRACRAQDAIESGEVVMEIPLRCLITLEMGKETAVGRVILDSDLDLDAPKHIMLMLFLLVDRKKPDSFFKPYYDILPATLSNMPNFWSDEEVDYLKGSYMQVQIAQRKDLIERDYEAICNEYPPFSEIATLTEFAWAKMCVCSRNFAVDINGLRTSVLVPYADMLNHLRPRETKWEYDDSVGGFVVTSLCNISNGAEVFDSYGWKCNHRFLLNYGFSVERNIEEDGYCPNEVPILVVMPRDDPFYDAKKGRWPNDGPFPSVRIRVSVGEPDSFRRLMSMLRCVAAGEEEMSYLRDNFPGGFRSIRELSVPLRLIHEVRTLVLLHEICDEYLSRYEHSLEEDIEQLKDLDKCPMFSNRRNAVIQLRGEKTVLHHYKDLAECALAFLRAPTMTEADIELATVSVSNRHKSIFEFIRSELYRLKMYEENRKITDVVSLG